jgi:hypothetical protein
MILELREDETKFLFSFLRDEYGRIARGINKSASRIWYGAYLYGDGFKWDIDHGVDYWAKRIFLNSSILKLFDKTKIKDGLLYIELSNEQLEYLQVVLSKHTWLLSHRSNQTHDHNKGIMIHREWDMTDRLYYAVKDIIDKKPSIGSKDGLS